MTDNDNPRSEAEDKALRDLARAESDLKNAEREVREAVEELEEAKRDETATINVDGTAYKVRRGKWRVSDLKAKVGVDPAKVLAEITPQGLKDLDDNAEIEVRANEKFMTHARSGGSS